MRTFPITRMIDEMDGAPGISTIEKAIDCFLLEDGRRVQLTVKLETDEQEWLEMEDAVKEAIAERDALRWVV